MHEWKPPYSAASGLCGATVMRDGGGDECGLPRDHPTHIHARNGATGQWAEYGLDDGDDADPWA